MSGAGLALVAGGGALPGAVLSAWPEAHLIRFAGAGCALMAPNLIEARFERLGALFEDLRRAGVERVCFAGAMQRPAIDPTLLDAVTMAAAPRVMAAMQGGDDGLLRAIIGLFEENGFAVIGAHTLVPGLVAGNAEGLMIGAPDADQARDAARGAAILAALGPVDVGQACVVAGGLCFGVETVQGTDALLGFVAQSRAGLRPETGGVLIKRAKPGQDLRVDMPAIGPDTVTAAAAAGLTGIALQAGHVLVLERAEVAARARAAGLTLWAVA